MTLYQIIALDQASEAARDPKSHSDQARMLAAARMSDRLHG